MSVSEGELKHEQCAYGTLTKAWTSEPAPELKWKGTSMPLCIYPTPANVPPWAVRAWHGAVDFERDCAVCTCFKEVDPDVPYTWEAIK
jgi:hypothetical protein